MPRPTRRVLPSGHDRAAGVRESSGDPRLHLRPAGGLAAVINVMFRTSWGSVINITDMIHVIWAGLFGVEPLNDTPLWVAWVSPAIFCAACLLLLARKLRPYEVVR